MVQALTGSPSAILYKLLVYVFFTYGNNIYYVKTDANGILQNNFSDVTIVPNTGSTFSPYAVVFQNYLYLFHHGINDNGDLWYNRFDGTNWNGDTLLCVDCISKSPNAVVYNNKLYVFTQQYGGTGIPQYRVSSDGINWSAVSTVPGTYLSESPSGCQYIDRLYLFHQSNQYTGDLYYQSTIDGTNWLVDIKIHGVGMTASPRAITHIDGRMYIFHQSYATTGKLYFLVRDGQNWIADALVPGVDMSDSPSAVSFNNRLYVFYASLTGGDIKYISTVQVNQPWGAVNTIKINIPFIISSYPKYASCKCETGDCPNPGCPTDPVQKATYSFNLIKSQFQSMQKIKTKYIGDHVQGTLINGELTEFGKKDQLSSFVSLLNTYMPPTPNYLALGGSDYQDNLGNCAGDSPDNNGCASRMVDYLYNWLKSATTVSSYDFSTETVSTGIYRYKGSLAYSFNIDKIHIVQLQNNPTFTAFWSNTQPIAPAFTGYYEITSPFSWLQSDLNAARSRGDHVIIVIDNYGYGWDSKIFANIILKKYNISAVFAGNTPQIAGFFGNLENNTPIFYTGSAMYKHYLLTNFDLNNNQIVVKRVVNNDSGDVSTFTLNSSVPLRSL
eukprot:gene859-1071_t